MRIDATELIGVQLSDDGNAVQLKLRDQNGQMFALSMPTGWMTSILSATPHCATTGEVQRVGSWSMDQANASGDLVLTLRTLDGHAVSFMLKRWQIEGMATIATYGLSEGRPQATIH